MTDDETRRMTDRRFNGTLAAIPIAYLALAVGLAQVDRPIFWGINHLRYYPSWVWVACAMLLILTAVPAFRERVAGISLPKLPFIAVSAGLAIIGLIAFTSLDAATQLLGDGYLLTRELEHGFRKIANEPLSLWLLDRVNRRVDARGVSAFDVYTFWSIASGVVFLLLLPALGRRLTEASSWVIVLLALLPAYTQLFFGYHETYPVLYPLLLLYVWCAIGALREDLPRWVPLALLGLLVALHFKLATLIPSAIFLLAPHGSIRDRVQSLSSNALACLPGLLVFALLLWLTDFKFGVYESRASEETFLPLTGGTTHAIPYTAFSLAHLVELTNELLLVYLPILLLLPFVTRAWCKTEMTQFLLVAAVPALLTTFFGFTVIGAFRDWDALAFPALLFALWAGTGLVSTMNSARLRSVVVVVTATAGVHLVLWISVNADEVRATRRFEDNLEYSNLSPRARSFGWETIGAHYLEQSDLGKATLAYERAIEHAPNHPRYPSQLGFVLMQVGDYVGAAEQFRRAIRLDDQRFEPHLNLGMALLKLDEAAGAVNAIRKAWSLQPDRAQIPFALGVAYYALEDYEKAIGACLAVLRIDPDHVDAHMQLAQLYGLISDHARQRDHFERVLVLNPNHPQKDEIQAWLAWYTKQYE